MNSPNPSSLLTSSHCLCKSNINKGFVELWRTPLLIVLGHAKSIFHRCESGLLSNANVYMFCERCWRQHKNLFAFNWSEMISAASDAVFRSDSIVHWQSYRLWSYAMAFSEFNGWKCCVSAEKCAYADLVTKMSRLNCSMLRNSTMSFSNQSVYLHDFMLFYGLKRGRRVNPLPFSSPQIIWWDTTPMQKDIWIVHFNRKSTKNNLLFYLLE